MAHGIAVVDNHVFLQMVGMVQTGDFVWEELENRMKHFAELAVWSDKSEAVLVAGFTVEQEAL
jgi:RecJ-like exonuclease